MSFRFVSFTGSLIRSGLHSDFRGCCESTIKQGGLVPTYISISNIQCSAKTSVNSTMQGRSSLWLPNMHALTLIILQGSGSGTRRRVQSGRARELFGLRERKLDCDTVDFSLLNGFLEWDTGIPRPEHCCRDTCIMSINRVTV